MNTTPSKDHVPLGPQGSTLGDVEMTPVEARSAVKLGVMRWVLGISIALTLVGFLIAWLVGRGGS